MDNVCINVPSQTVSTEGASTDETKKWQDAVSTMRATYEKAIDDAADRISERQRSDLKSYVKDMIQISTGILGLITGVVAMLIGAFRGNVPKRSRN